MHRSFDRFSRSCAPIIAFAEDARSPGGNAEVVLIYPHRYGNIKMRKKYYDKIRLVKVRPRTDRALVLKGTFENPC